MSVVVPLNRAMAVERLRRAGCVLPEAEVDAALGEWMGLPEAEVPSRLGDYVCRRETGLPPAYIMGGIRFRGRWIRVGPGAFIPRPWTEAIVTAALELAGEARRVADVGTGSGAIAAALAQDLPGALVWATEIDESALRWAQSNLAGLPTVTLLRGDLLDPLPLSEKGRLDLVAGCLPYVPSEAIATMARDAREHEPAMALDGGRGGLAIVLRALRQAAEWLAPGGCVVLELGDGQGEEAVQACQDLGFSGAEARPDAEGADAMIVARR